ncbi:MAG: hypothetical protein JSU83_23705 [Deltaproteobacteria bacterium]|nr:MAG: hypothetical protein JSU83_23705 [Deltaproteobacteria bacterium]
MAVKKLILLILAFLLFRCAGLETQQVQPEPKEKSAMHKLLEQGDKVSLAIAFISIESPAMIEMKGEQFFRGWARSIATELLGNAERVLLKKYRKYPNFRLIDRFSVDRLLDEYKFQHMGYTREVDAAKIGKLLNATHLELLSFSRMYTVEKAGWGYKEHYHDISTMRLIEIQTGTLIDSKIAERHSYGGKWSKWKLRE